MQNGAGGYQMHAVQASGSFGFLERPKHAVPLCFRPFDQIGAGVKSASLLLLNTGVGVMIVDALKVLRFNLVRRHQRMRIQAQSHISY